jgi:hypothetical protein
MNIRFSDMLALALTITYSRQLIVELPGTPQVCGVRAAILAVPIAVGSPKGTVQVPE